MLNIAHILVSTLGSLPDVALSVPDLEASPATSPVAAGTDAALEPVAQDPVAPLRQEDPWRFDAFIYYWSAGVTGNLTVDGQDVDIEDGGEGFSGDIALKGFLGHFEAHHGPWSFALAPMFVTVNASGDEAGGIDADIEIHAEIHEAFVAHDLGRTWDCFAGARYYQLDTSVDLSSGGVPISSHDSNHSWIDPIVGVRYQDDYGEHWSLRARADVGGFGVGSDFAWNASALVGYRFDSTWSAQLGYRALHVDFGEGSGSDRVAYDLTMAGPVIGVDIAF